MSEIIESRIMALDFGMKRIGIALSDSLKMFAYTLVTIPNDEKTFKQLASIIREKNIIEIVLGIPNENRVSKTSVVENIKKFKEQLEKTFLLKVILWDETFTSSIAQQRIIESVNKKQKRRNKDLLDMHSAAIILQEYLDSIKSN
jgi:putative holliday junction resolvase